MSPTHAPPAPESERAPSRPKGDAKLAVPRRAHTFQSGTNAERASPFTAPESDSDQAGVYDANDNDDSGDAVRASVDMGELPIELVSLTDR